MIQRKKRTHRRMPDRTTAVLFAVLLAWVALRSDAQPVVVSEYYNDNPPQEWTEILVVQDNMDLRGWVVTDNNASQTSRQGGVRFRNIPYWQHVRAGTIIGIWHRDYLSTAAQDLDTSMADGRVMLAKNDARFFEPYASPDVQFPDAPMNLAQEGDIMEILDANGNHIHGLGHRSTPGSYWLAMAEPKLNTASALNNGQSNRVYPGGMLSQYNGPHGAPLSEACAVNITRTMPNKSCASSASNWEFWHSLRRPDWNSPQLQATVSATTVELAWNSATDPYPLDGLSGYIIARDSAGQDFLPEQGRIYRNGERIGSTIILAHLPSTATSYTDPVVLTCGITYSYRVFAFRFGQDDEYGAYPPQQSTRGRQYNTVSFGAITVLKQVERGPSIRTDGSPTTFCEGGAVVLSVQSVPVGYTAQWLRNGAAITGATTNSYRATETGEYRLRLQRPDGCFVLSDSVVITVHPKPSVTIFPTARIQLCEDSTTQLTAPYVEQWRYQWYRDGSAISGATGPTIVISGAGSYSVEVTNEFGCSARSDATTIEILRLQLTLSQQAITFQPLSGCESVREVNIQLQNQSNFPIELRRAIEPQHFFVVSPSLPNQLLVGEQRTLTLRFAPTTTGTWTDSIGIEIQPCGKVQWITVHGTKSGAAGALSTQSTIKDFGIVTRCNDGVQPKTDSIIITASGALTVENIRVLPPFRLGAGYPTSFTMQAGQSRAIPIEFAPILDQPYSRDLTISYTSAQCRDSLVVPLRGTLTTRFIALSAREIVFPPLDSCTTVFADTTITLYNTSLAPIDIEQLSDEQLQIVQPISSPTLHIPPQDSVRIRIRYSPNGFTASQQRLAIVFGDQRCTQSEVLIVRGMRTGSSITLSTSSIEFPPVIRCKETAPLSQSLVLSVSSIPSDASGARVVSISSTQQWLSTSLTPGPLNDGDHSFNVMIDPRQLAIGQNTGTISIRVEPCGRILTLQARVNVEDIALGFGGTGQTDTLLFDLGDIRVGRTVPLSADVTNNSSFELRFAPLQQLPPWLDVTASFLPPGSMPAQSTQTITLTVTPTQEGPLHDTLYLDAIEPCTRRLVIIITGRAVGDTIGSSPLALHVVIPESITASPGDQVRFSIRFEGLTRPILVDSISIPLSFDRSLFHVEQLVAGAALSAGSLSGISTSTGYRATIQNADIRGPGDVAYLEGRVLLGSTLQTALSPDSASIAFSDSTIRVMRTVPGWLRLEEHCNLNARLIQLGGTAQMMLQQNASDLTVTIEQVSSSVAQLTVYDLSGRVVMPVLNRYLERGSHTFLLPLSTLSSGVYLLSYTSDGIARSVLFAVE